MIKRIIYILVILLCAMGAEAQQLPMYSQYMHNPFIVNPAVAGTRGYIPLRLTARQQWMGLKNAPSTQTISGHMLLKNQTMGIGGYLYNDKFGPVSQTGLNVAYSYQILMYSIDSKLSFGLAASAYQYSINGTDLKPIDANDNALYLAKESAFVPDANFGLYLFNPRYFVGFSANNLIEMPLKLSQEIDDNKLKRHYFGMAGVKIEAVDDLVDIEPSILIKKGPVAPMQVDINVKGYYEDLYWLGFSYRHKNAFVTMLGIRMEKYFVGYSYDFPLSDIGNYTKGSHEIHLGYNIGDASTALMY